MPCDLTEITLLQQFAVERFGETGFRCPRCGHTRAWTLRCRPRVRQCRGCRRQVSVTAGTAMHATRLPMRVWRARGEAYAQGDLPSARGLAVVHDIAPSSAWHLNQRFMKATAFPIPRPSLFAHTQLEVVVRPPNRLPLSADAPTRLRQLVEDHPRTRRGPAQRCLLTLAHWSQDVWLKDAWAEPDPTFERWTWASKRGLPWARPGLCHWLYCQLVLALRSVSARWLGRYLEHAIGLFQRDREPPAPWLRALQASPAVPLLRLRPWDPRVRLPG